MYANMSTKVGRNSDKLRNSKFHFIVLCAVLILSTLTACVYAIRADHDRELYFSSREVLKFHELFQIQLVVYEAAVNEVADVLHFDRVTGAEEFDLINHRVLSQKPLLHSLGWVRGPSSPEPQKLNSLYDNAARDLSGLWYSAEWLQVLESGAEENKAVVSQPLLAEIEGEVQYLSLYLVPVDSYATLDEEPLVGGFAFGVIQIQKSFIDTIAASQEMPARVQLMDKLSTGEQQEVAVSQKGNSPLSDGHEASSPLIWGERVMQLRLTPTQEYVSNTRSFVPWFVGGLGLVLFALMYRLYSSLEKITDSQRAELRRRESDVERKQLEITTLMEVAPVAIIVLDREGVIVNLGLNAISLMREQSLGKKFAEQAIDGTYSTLDGEPVMVQNGPLLRAFRGERIVNLQLLRRQQQQDFYYSFSASPIIDAKGEISGAVSVSVEVTDLVQSIENQKHVNIQLESSNQRLQQFASVASHDLQEPLRKITSFASLLEMEIGDKLHEQPKQYLDFMVDGAKRMSVLIRDILQYSEITPGTEGLATVDLSEAFAVIQSEFSGIIETSGAEVSVKNSLPIYTSARMLPRLLGNLISNSIKYKRDSAAPVIEIDAKQQVGGVLVSLSDNGMGIPEEYREQVFNMFKRLHGNSSIPGTGIGLSICKQIVELNGGRIWIEESSSGGSQFLMFFPECNRAVVAPT